MWDCAYTMPESSDIAMALIRYKVLDIRRQNGKAVQCISLPKPTAFLACMANLGKMEERLTALEARQASDEYE